ncbi:MAG: DUF4352 domain-containing protein [Actinomycetota bacterium]
MADAGWYPSPGEPGSLRYWDGAAWTEYVHDGSVGAAPAPPPADLHVPIPPAETPPAEASTPAPQPPPPGAVAPTEATVAPNATVVAPLAAPAGADTAPPAAPFAPPAQPPSGPPVVGPTSAPAPPGAPPPAGSSSTGAPGRSLLALVGVGVVLLVILIGVVVLRAGDDATDVAGQPVAPSSDTADTTDGAAASDDSTTAAADEEAPADEPASAAGVETAEGPVPLGAPVDAGPYRLVVHEVLGVQSANEFSQPEAGNRYVAVDLEITNRSGETLDLNPFSFEVFDTQGFAYAPAVADARRPRPTGVLLAGQTRRGDLTFEVPDEATLSLLVLQRLELGVEPLGIDLTGAPPSEVPATTDDGSVGVPTLAPLGEVVDGGSFRYLIHGATEVSAESDFEQPEPGNVFIAVDMELTNQTGETEGAPIFGIQAFDADGVAYDYGFKTPRNDAPIGDVLPGQTRRGDLTFEVPAGTTLTYLVVGDVFDGTPQAIRLQP